MYDRHHRVKLRSSKEVLYPSERWLARRDLRKIQKALNTFPREQDSSTESTETFNACSRSRHYNRLGFYALTDGVAVTYTQSPKGWLADLSHRFIFPDDGEPSYHRESFNVDRQAIAGPPLNLRGIDELTSRVESVDQISIIYSSIISTAKTGWDNMEIHREPAANC